jgi:hypothetical protein
MANIQTFKADLKAFTDKIKAVPATVQKKVVLDLWASITRRTPVDTGRARANWFVTEGQPSARVDLHPGAKKGEVPEPAAPDVSGLDGTKSVFIINNLPYIEALENGHSRQAPNGMVRLAIQAAELRMRNALKEPGPL